MKRYDYIIAGTGASGLQIAWCMSRDPFFSEKKILLIDKESKDHNDKTWCFWERGNGDWDDILEHSWKQATFRTRQFDKTYHLGDYTYKMLRSGRFYSFVFDRLAWHGGFMRINAEIDSIENFDKHALVRTNVGVFEGGKVISSIPPKRNIEMSTKHPWLSQHFKGWFINTDEDCFDPEKVLLMDFTVPQSGNTRFIYMLPTGSRSALVEYTLFSKELLTAHEYDRSLRDYLQSIGVNSFRIIEEEQGVIPMTTHPFHHNNESSIIYVGTAGGWTKASTGYTFYNAGKKARMLCTFLKTQQDLRQFHVTGRFAFYDHVMLDLLSRHNSCGAEFFESIYRKQSIASILDFLNEETTTAEEIGIILKSSPRMLLLKSAMRTIRHFIFNGR